MGHLEEIPRSQFLSSSESTWVIEEDNFRFEVNKVSLSYTLWLCQT